MDAFFAPFPDFRDFLPPNLYRPDFHRPIFYSPTPLGLCHLAFTVRRTCPGYDKAPGLSDLWITENKKGNKKKGGTRNRQVDSDEENQLNAEIEMQIQDEIEKALEGGDSSDSAGGGKEAVIGDLREQNDVSINGTSKFSFEAPRALPSTRNSDTTSREPVTPTKFSENHNFLKRSINDLSFTPEPDTRKNPRPLHSQNNSLLTQILSKLPALSNTVESQTAHIVALEKRIEEVTFHSKGNTQASKANQVAAKRLRQWRIG